jgi:hypothetical protein
MILLTVGKGKQMSEVSPWTNGNIHEFCGIHTNLLSFEILIEKYADLIKNEIAMTDKLTSHVNYFRNKNRKFYQSRKKRCRTMKIF